MLNSFDRVTAFEDFSIIGNKKVEMYVESYVQHIANTFGCMFDIHIEDFYLGDSDDSTNIFLLLILSMTVKSNTLIVISDKEVPLNTIPEGKDRILRIKPRGLVIGETGLVDVGKYANEVKWNLDNVIGRLDGNTRLDYYEICCNTNVDLESLMENTYMFPGGSYV